MLRCGPRETFFLFFEFFLQMLEILFWSLKGPKIYSQFNFSPFIKFHPRYIIEETQFSYFPGKKFFFTVDYIFHFSLIFASTFFHSFHLTGDSIFTAGKPAILTNNTLIRGSKALNNRRPITSSSSTISSQSTNNETGRTDKDRKDKTLKDSMQQRYLMDSGN